MNTTALGLPPVHIWMNFPSHHQSGFFAALRERGVDLTVTYYEQVTPQRIAQGWGSTNQINTWESFLSELQLSANQRLAKLPGHIHILPGYGSPTTLALARQASHAGIKWCHWSEASFSGLRWYLRYFKKRNYAQLVNAHAVGAFAQGMMARRDFMRWGVRADKTADLMYSTPLPPDNVTPNPEIVQYANGRRVFLFVGRLIHQKAIDISIKAFAALKTTDWCLVFVGTGKDGRYQQLAQRCGIADRSLFLPPVNWTDVSAVHAAGDVLLLPSRFDGWGAVANEAAALGKPLILSTNCGSASHLLRPGINGFLIDPGNVLSLTNAMQLYAVGGKSLLQRHGNASLQIVKDYTADANALRLINTLRSWLST